MTTVLISGLPGTGKTTVQHELDKLGYDTLSSDEAWGYYGTIATGEPIEKPAEPDKQWFMEHGYIWNVSEVRAVLSTPREKPLFVCGGSRNQEEFYDLFDTIFVLHASDQAIRQRLLVRNDPNASSEMFIPRMLEYNKTTYNLATRTGGIIVETEQPLDAVMSQILRDVYAS